jgi:hypothetical protein
MPEEAFSIIEYLHLIELTFAPVHIDYVKQFLFSLNTRLRLPSLNSLCIEYEKRLTVTENFTRNATRTNCAKLKSIVNNVLVE